MIDEKEIEIDGKVFILSKYPALIGREIMSKYPLSALPKLGDYAVNEEIAIKNLSYVQVYLGDRAENKKQALVTKELINNYTGSWETCLKLEWEMIQYNSSFLQNGQAINFLDGLAQKAQSWTSKLLTGLSAQLLQTEKPPTTN